MDTWMIRINGQDRDIEFLSQIVKSTGSSSIIQKDGHFYLKSDEFRIMNNASEVFKHGNQLLKILFNIANLYNEELNSISCDSSVCFDDNGNKSVYIFTLDVINIEARANCIIVTSDLHEMANELERQQKEYEVLINAARKDMNICAAINFYLTPNWINLYKIYELIRDDVTEKKIISNGWTTKRNISRFTQSAQSRELLGDEARHASKKYPLPSDPMNINEAKNFIKYLLFDWMKSKQYS